MVASHVWALTSGILVSVAISFFFSMSETALLTVNRTRLRYLADHGDKRARLAIDLLRRPRRLLATILIGNNVVNIVASVLTTALAIEFLGSYALGISAGLLTLVLLIVGEITPKTFANEHSEFVTLRVARPVLFFRTLLRPLEWILSKVAKALTRASGLGRIKPIQFHTEEEIKVLLKMGREQGHIGDHEAKLIRAVFEFNDLELADVMRPEPEVTFVRPLDPLSRVGQLVARTGHSRFPVLEPGGKRPVGLLYAKDLLLMSADQVASLTAGSVVRAMPSFPPETRLSATLEKMQQEGSQMAAVVDEAGDMIGIVTFEDLLEEIVGEITDEYELARRRLRRERARLDTGESPRGPSPGPPASPPATSAATVESAESARES